MSEHMSSASFVADVLLYDRLVAPMPPDDAPPERYRDAFEPELQARCLETLGRKTDSGDGLALPLPRDDKKRESFKSKMSTAAAIAAQKGSPRSHGYIDPLETTKSLLGNKFKPALPSGVSHPLSPAMRNQIHLLRSQGLCHNVHIELRACRVTKKPSLCSLQRALQS